MSDSIRARCIPETIELGSHGSTAEIIIAIENRSTIVDQYAIEIDGLPATWYTLSKRDVALFPQDKDEAKLSIHLPHDEKAHAGAYRFSITIRSLADPTQSTIVESEAQVQAAAAFALDLSPQVVTGRRGRYTLTLHNTGNTRIDAVLSATDPEEGCRFTFSTQDVHLEKDHTTSLGMLVQPQRSPFVGMPKPYLFQVHATAGEDQPKVAQGELIHTPFLRTWRPIRRAIVLALLLALLISALTVGGVRAFTCHQIHILCPGGTETPTPATAAPTGTAGSIVGGGAAATLTALAGGPSLIMATPTVGVTPGAGAPATSTRTLTPPANTPVSPTGTPVSPASSPIPPTGTPVAPTPTSTSILPTSTPVAPSPTTTTLPSLTPTTMPTDTATTETTETPTSTAADTATPTSAVTATEPATDTVTATAQ